MSSSPLLHAYHERLAAGLAQDSAQLQIVKALAHAQAALLSPQEHRPRLLDFFVKKGKDYPRGLYLWGSVGRGKSMLMDLFFHTTALPRKRRAHFHAFMLDVHARIHAVRQSEMEANPVDLVAEQISREADLLCLDELQVGDVADAMILDKLFTGLLDAGTAIVFTSNRPPEELYQGGLQRDRFLRFIALIRERMDILELRSDKDYRLGQIRALEKVYFTPPGAAADAFLEQTFKQLTAHQPSHPTVFEYQGRKLTLPRTYGGTAFCTFAELCMQPLAAADYLLIAQKFHTLLLSGIPQLSPKMRNEAKRFVVLIDALYEHKVTLICTAAAPPESLYLEGDGAFEFRRTASRLAEMQSRQYLGARHV